jgi:hypothetical protein
MIYSNIALDVGGIFLVMAGLMYLSLSGRIGDMFRDRAPKPLFAIALVLGFAVYHWGPMLYGRLSLPELAAPDPRVAIPEPTPAAKPDAPKHPVRALPRASAPPTATAPEPEHWQAVIVQEAPPAQVLAPPAPNAALSPSGPDPYESKAKRGLNAVGRFLHIQKKPQP